MVHNPGGDWNPGWGVDLRYKFFTDWKNTKKKGMLEAIVKPLLTGYVAFGSTVFRKKNTSKTTLNQILEIPWPTEIHTVSDLQVLLILVMH